MTARWTTPADIAVTVRRRWDDGSLLAALAREEPFPVVDLPVRGPRAAEIGDDLAAAQTWSRRLDQHSRDGARYQLEWTSVGGRHIGRTRIPARARVTGFDQAWALLGVHREVREFELILASAAHPDVRAWVLAHPLRAVRLAGPWAQLLAAHAWLDAHRGSGRYLREISAPGVDTKFAEAHRAVLAGLLGVPATAPGFLAALGLRSKPELVRMRVGAGLGLPAPLTELTVRADELAALDVRPRRALVIENEITFLSAPAPEDGVVLWGHGFEVDRVGRLPWLESADVIYWGDLDTHGFAILDRLRAWLPHARSVLMDRQTLLAHRDRWVTEDRPATSRLSRLSHAEGELYADLVGDVLGDRVRLEQELIDWSWASERLGAVES